MKSRIAVVAAGAVAALAAAPAASQAATSPPQPGPICFETVQFAVCSSDAGPLAQQALNDPAGTAGRLAGLGVRIVCESSPAVDCSITS